MVPADGLEDALDLDLDPEDMDDGGGGSTTTSITIRLDFVTLGRSTGEVWSWSISSSASSTRDHPDYQQECKTCRTVERNLPSMTSSSPSELGSAIDAECR